MNDPELPARRQSVRLATRDERHQTGRRGSDYAVARADLPAKLAQRIEVQDGHWLWTGPVNNKGYGAMRAQYRTDPTRKPNNRSAHVLVWEALIGIVPPDFQLDHLCDFKVCVNPQCLEEVTPAENQQRASDRQVTCKRAGHPRTPENIYTDPHGGTRCRPCARERDRQPTRLARSAERRRKKHADRKAVA